MHSKKLLILGSNARVTNLPVKEVSLLAQGSLPAYGYNPGDFIELLAGNVTVVEGRIEECITWLSSFLTNTELTPEINTITYGALKEIFQLFRKTAFNDTADTGHGWFMVHQILPPGGRHAEPDELEFSPENQHKLHGNDGIIIVDDGGSPPKVADELKRLNPNAWAIALGISAARWECWADHFGESFTLFCRRSDLETTRMEMDSAILWETIIAMTLRGLKNPEVGLFDASTNRFRCNIVVEMYPGGILFITPERIFFRHREGRGVRPDRGAARERGSVPCYDTMPVAMLAIDSLRLGRVPVQREYIFDFSRRTLNNWFQIFDYGYYFSESLEFPNIDFKETYPSGAPCSIIDRGDDHYFFELPSPTPELDRTLELLASQEWTRERKVALRGFLAHATRICGLPERKKTIYPPYFNVILNILGHLKDEVNRKNGFKRLRMFQLGNLKTIDPAEIEPVITLYNVIESYITKENYKRPLCVGVFGPPGSGKSFSVEEVARVISRRFAVNPFDFFQFNLTQFTGPEEINAAIDLVRASVARGKIPIAFWDEFDCRYAGDEFGYLRYFLPAMQDGVTYVHGTPRYIGRSIFVFAGGVKSSWDDMMDILQKSDAATLQMVKTLKIPDFMSRLRVVLDIDGIEIPDRLLRDSSTPEELEELERILLKRALIIAHQMNSHWKKAARKTSGLLLRLLLADYKFGARSMEAVIETSQVADKLVYGLPELIPPPAARIHATWRVDLERRVDAVRKELGMRGVW
ncbi:MAG: ATPase [Dissulfuribacterales bacterium]